MEGLRRWVEGSGGRVDSRLDLRETACGCSRTLTAGEPYKEGETIVRIPWCRALNLRSALRRHSVAEKGGKGDLLLGGLQGFLSFCKSAEGVGHSTISLLVALQICGEASPGASGDMRSYTSLLPAPPPPEPGEGGPSLSDAVRGPPLIHPLLFEEDQLDELQNAGLSASIRRERGLLRFIYDTALNSEALSFRDFLWSIAIVRSRSLNLSLHLEGKLQEAHGEALQCMLPLIDLCDHSAGANCSLRCCISGSAVGAIELVAQADIDEGSPMTIDYGHRPLRDFFRCYGFTPDENESRSEVFEDADHTPLESVLVGGHRGGGFFSLRRILLLSSLPRAPPEPGSDRIQDVLDGALLEKRLLLDSDGCGLLYEIEDESSQSVSSFRDCPEVLGGLTASGGRLFCDQGTEALAISRVLDYFQGLSDRMPTTLEEDEVILKGSGLPLWEQASVRYRMARKALMGRVVGDLKGAQLAAA
ncbi:Rubisco LSMT substrate-binding domain-containing protein [Chloropicon primus]|nr:Rubisco LSMT substrate-binding domain-containing protein [Chloropicon primus]